MSKKHQLGMNPSTASNRLVKDLLFSLAVEAGHKCFQCGGVLTRDTFSIEHKTPWLHSDDPVKTYFDLGNIGFSHLSCNIGAARKVRNEECGTDTKYSSGCRCEECKTAHATAKRSRYCPDARRAKYLSKGQ